MRNAFVYIFVFLAFISATLSSCKTRPPSQIDVVHVDDTIKEDTAVVVVVPVDTAIVVIEDTIDTTDNFKAVYRVGLIMPLMEDSFKSNWSSFNEVDYNDLVVPGETELSMSFLEGLMIGAEQMSSGPQLEILLYDNDGNSFGTKRALGAVENDGVDLLIGGSKKANVKLIAEYAKKNELPYISPISASTTAAIDNEFYLMLEPSIYSHMYAILHYMADSLRNPAIKVFYEDTDLGKKYAAYISTVLEQANDSIKNLAKKINYSLIEVGLEGSDRRNFKIGEHLDVGVQNAVFIPSFDDGFVHALLTQLNARTTAYEFSTFGMPTWESSETSRLEYLNSLAVHVTRSSFPLEKNGSDAFESTYKSTYEKEPTNLAYLGFDVINMLSEALNERGNNFVEYLSNNTYEGISRNVRFHKVMNETKMTQRLENSEVHILKYEDFDPILVK